MMQSAKRRENNMKAIDFMGGDWVLINGTPHKVQAVDGVDNEIMADDELYTLAEDRYHSEDKVEGVPLTTEILKKNGFKDGQYFSELYIQGWHVISDTRNLCMECERGRHMNIKCRCVHELQHAFDLVGINKDFVV